ncbi:hypothetical protein ABZX85_24120 [Streptomyces sp. NPDC004539]|uniref:hypothetical protein n=1 Tax=Streptomyces sp. NPDC004539 TaxID=3154280 RepID=UPI0033B22226
MEVPAPLSGYAHPGHGIAPAEQHLALPGFWSAYLSVSRGDTEEFGADLADVDAAYEALYDATRTWPAFRLPLSSGRTVWIVFANFPDDPGVDYLLTDPAHPTPRTLAATEGPFAGPALSWPDLLAIAEDVPQPLPGPTAVQRDDGVLDPDHRLLLLLPAYGDIDTPTEAALERVTTALLRTGVPRATAPALAERLLDTGTTWDASGVTPLSGAGTP